MEAIFIRSNSGTRLYLLSATKCELVNKIQSVSKSRTLKISIWCSVWIPWLFSPWTVQSGLKSTSRLLVDIGSKRLCFCCLALSISLQINTEPIFSTERVMVEHHQQYHGWNRHHRAFGNRWLYHFIRHARLLKLAIMVIFLRNNPPCFFKKTTKIFIKT